MVGFFNPGSETDNESMLRLVNPNTDEGVDCYYGPWTLVALKEWSSSIDYPT